MTGFVYMLSNPLMPDAVKIGHTKLHPTKRAEQLSAPTGVPCPFEVVCFIEVEHAQLVERDLHHRLRELRVERRREFFWAADRDKALLVGLFEYHPCALDYDERQVGAFMEPGHASDVVNPWRAG